MSSRNPRGQRPTLEAVAALAGVGRGTVSRVVNGAPGVSAKARTAVEAAIAELNYVPNPAARSLVTSRTDSIALVIPESESRLAAEPYFNAVIRGVSTELADTEMQLLLILVRNPRELYRLTRFVEARRVDGVLLVAVHQDDPLVAFLEKTQMPTVLAGRRSPDESLSHVHSDNVGGAAQAVRHLLGQGRTTVATVAGPLDMDVGRSRLQGWRDAHTEHGTPPDESLAVSADFTEEGGRAAMGELLDRHPGLDAVFVASDVMAAGALTELRERGRRVPEDVAIIGFDDSIVARHTVPPLTSVNQASEDIGRAITRLLLEEINDPSAPRQYLTLPTTLTHRRTT
ncbi:LacI family DNA-binding transcriptional regulator [Streptomyces sp. SID3212]|uniref:LacI family DNA-binding transcriptional regulator n=1 Tax=unclassified Streptomyces TaxID=2593676 RepID=UPI0013689DC8|nr:LacI family DNA-binding transcriptional regulator [Streptomyces sp. SID3212]MYV57860.1 substrate-binding domain-containing protein [Streptomyces sp. SID3212]